MAMETRRTVMRRGLPGRRGNGQFGTRYAKGGQGKRTLCFGHCVQKAARTPRWKSRSFGGGVEIFWDDSLGTWMASAAKQGLRGGAHQACL